MTEWQPIKTAPQDGTMILLVQNGVQYTAYWRTETKIGPCWSTPDSMPLFCPSHWMALPPLPDGIR
jgi:hypothetical protein